MLSPLGVPLWLRLAAGRLGGWGGEGEGQLALLLRLSCAVAQGEGAAGGAEKGGEEGGRQVEGAGAAQHVEACALAAVALCHHAPASEGEVSKKRRRGGGDEGWVNRQTGGHGGCGGRGGLVDVMIALAWAGGGRAWWGVPPRVMLRLLRASSHTPPTWPPPQLLRAVPLAPSRALSLLNALASSAIPPKVVEGEEQGRVEGGEGGEELSATVDLIDLSACLLLEAARHSPSDEDTSFEADGARAFTSVSPLHVLAKWLGWIRRSLEALPGLAAAVSRRGRVKARLVRLYEWPHHLAASTPLPSLADPTMLALSSDVVGQLNRALLTLLPLLLPKPAEKVVGLVAKLLALAEGSTRQMSSLAEQMLNAVFLELARPPALSQLREVTQVERCVLKLVNAAEAEDLADACFRYISSKTRA